MTNPQDRERRAFAIFSQALDVAAQDRAAFIAAETGEDSDLLEEVRTLLAADHQATDEQFLSNRSSTSSIGEITFGEFRVVRELARGGMGTVYEADQDRPRRRVALKVLDPALCHGSVLRRFEVEAEVLAHLEHPAIARVIASGVRSIDSLGVHIQLPWLAMELLDGALPVTQYVADSRLSLRERLAMFRTICDAVEHAHRKGVIHRDIKPGNVLVGRDGRPKLIDFGIARRVPSGDRSPTQHTERGEILGTLRYMAPEQFRGDPTAIDARSDVYALGVLLCEMLTGKPPLDPSSADFASAASIALREPPTPPSRLASEMPREIDAIVLKALEKDPDRRYASVLQLDDDVRRFLASEPILAAPPTRRRVVALFVRRHRLAFAASLAVVLSLIGGWIATLVALDRARTAEREALDEAAISSRFFTLFKSAFQRARPDKQGTELKVVDILDLLAEPSEALIPERPQASAELSNQVAVLYATLGASEKAQAILERALAHLESAGELESRIGVGTLQNLAELRSRHSQFELARDDLERASQIATRILDANDSLHADIQHRRGATLMRMKEYAAAETLFRNAVGLREANFGRDHLDTLSSLNSLNIVLQELGRLDEAEVVAREVVDRMTALVGQDNPSTLMARNNLAALYADRRKWAEAGAEFEQVLTAQQAKLPADHPDILLSRQNLARHHIRSGDVERGLGELKTVAIAYEERFGIADARTVACVQLVLDMLANAGRGDEALTIGNQALEKASALEPKVPRAVGGIHIGLANALYKLDRFEEAEHEAEVAHEILAPSVGVEAAETKRARRIRETARQALEQSKDLGTPSGAKSGESP